MKNFILFLLLLFTTISCEHLDLPQDILTPSESTSVSSSDLTTIRVLTRSNTPSDLVYPLHIYAFHHDGTLVASQQISETDTHFTLSLPRSSSYRLIAISADTSIYDIPQYPTSSSLITMRSPQLLEGSSAFLHSMSQGYATRPLQMGTVDITPTTENATATIQLNYQVASLQVTLSHLPEESTQAYISVSSPSQALTFTGAFTGSQTSRIPLNPTYAVLSSSQGELLDSTRILNHTAQAYLFPTSQSTTFTISYADREGERFASVHYLSPLQAGTPYILQGTCEDGNLHLSGSVTPSTWNDAVKLSFTFHPDNPTTINSSSPSSSPTSPATIPEPLSIHDGHLLLAVIDSEGNPISSISHASQSPSLKPFTLLYLSLTDYPNLTSAFNTANPTTALTLASSYSEYDLADSWRIPTPDEALLLRQIYLTHTDAVDSLLTSAQADPIVLTNDRGNNLRYLCTDATQTYSFKPGSSYNSLKSAGTTVKNYRLRLVYTSQLTLP